MKKALVLILVIFSCLTLLCSCKVKYVYDGEFADPFSALLVSDTLYLRGIPLEMALDEIERKYGTDALIFVPVAGEYKTKQGERFTAEVEDTCYLYFNSDEEFSRICFFISIYDDDGELLVKKQFNSYIEDKKTKKPDMTYVSEEFAKYWEVIAVRSDELQ